MTSITLTEEELYKNLEEKVLSCDPITLSLRKDFAIAFMKQGNDAEASIDLANEAVLYLTKHPSVYCYNS